MRMASRFPGAAGSEALWQPLETGGNAVSATVAPNGDPGTGRHRPLSPESTLQKQLAYR